MSLYYKGNLIAGKAGGSAGGVSRIVAGNNVTLTPSTGLGEVTIDVSDVVATGNGGVINGELYTLSNGDTQLFIENVPCQSDYTEAEPVYTVENDCMLAVKLIDDETFSLDIRVNDSVRPVVTTQIHANELATALFPVKKGSKIKIASPKSTSVRTIAALYFEEFKLHSLAPQIAMPDWGKTGKSFFTNTPILENGFVYFYVSDSGAKHQISVEINGKTAIYFNPNTTTVTGDLIGDSHILPVSKGDIVRFRRTIDDGLTWTYYDNISDKKDEDGFKCEWWLIYCKSVQQSHPTDCASYVVESGKFYSGTGQPAAEGQTNDSWYRLYNDGWCEMGGKKTYLASTGTNTETVTLAKSFLDTSFTLTFGAGSSGHASDDSHIVNEDQNYRTVNTFGIQVIDPNSSTKDAWNCWRAEGFVEYTPPHPTPETETTGGVFRLTDLSGKGYPVEDLVYTTDPSKFHPATPFPSGVTSGWVSNNGIHVIFKDKASTCWVYARAVLSTWYTYKHYSSKFNEKTLEFQPLSGIEKVATATWRSI